MLYIKPLTVSLAIILLGTSVAPAISSSQPPLGAPLDEANQPGTSAAPGTPEVVAPDWDQENSYWKDTYPSRPYSSTMGYETYEPAYRFGVDSYSRNPNRSFDDAEADMRTDWNTVRGKSTMEWEQAREAARDSYNRLYERNRGASSIESTR